MSPDRGHVSASPRTEVAMLRMRRAVYLVLGTLSVGAALSGLAILALLTQVRDSNQEIRRLGAELVAQGDDLATLLASDAQDRAGRVQRLNEALAAIQQQFLASDEAQALRLQEVRDQLVAHIDAIECASGTRAPRSKGKLPDLTRRSPSPAPASPEPEPTPPAPQERRSPVLVLPDQSEPNCLLDVLGVCIGG